MTISNIAMMCELHPQPLPPGIPPHNLSERALEEGRQQLLGGSLAGPEALARLLAIEDPEQRYQGHLLAQGLTRQHSGGQMRLYAPLYVHNHCQNICAYCGFRADNQQAREAIDDELLARELGVLLSWGLDQVLLVSGESAHHGVEYLRPLIAVARSLVKEVAIEVQAFDRAGYEALHQMGVHAVYLYQETYDRELYQQVHQAGLKRRFDRRKQAMFAAAEAGIERLGFGVLLGLGDWRRDSLACAEHIAAVQRAHPRVQCAMSFPRLRPASGANYDSDHLVDDDDFAWLISAWRLAFPTINLTLSTRESAALRDRLMGIAIDSLSAASCTAPGGYSRSPDCAGLAQFTTDDHRSVADIAAQCEALGLSCGMEPAA